jgi:hypothetical protein
MAVQATSATSITVLATSMAPWPPMIFRKFWDFFSGDWGKEPKGWSVLLASFPLYLNFKKNVKKKKKEKKTFFTIFYVKTNILGQNK